jgi:hypothetical protein
LKPERWGSPLVQEKYREERPVTIDIHDDDDDDDDDDNNSHCCRLMKAMEIDLTDSITNI